MTLLMILASMVWAQGAVTVSNVTITCGPQLANPPAQAVNLATECISDDLIVTTADGRLYIVTHPILMRASLVGLSAGPIGYVPDGFTGPDTLTTTESYIRLPIEFTGLMKSFKVAVTDNTANGSTIIRVRINGATAIDTLSGGPVAITIPAGAVGAQTWTCCRNGQINININRGDQVYWQIERQFTEGHISFHMTLAL